MRIRKVAGIVALVALVVASAPSVKAGETLQTVRGKQFHDCQILSKDPHGLTFRHRDGIAKLAFADMPAKAQKRFAFDAKAAQAFVRPHRPVPQVKTAPQRRQTIIAPSLVAHNRLSVAGVGARQQSRRPLRGGVRNPYMLNGSIADHGFHRAVLGGFLEPYYSGAFGRPAYFGQVPNGFFTNNTLRVGARPILASPIAPSMTSFSQLQDVRRSAARASVRASKR